ncbi:hypothetical protein MKZ38_009041 [Zalerion maritima]|uniref:Micro-fibrillar-associated protein 1 C-terminal domain-containing protein n=1 Tax=Zalerion maritima TaxID=339359 RepID=A0AAD5WT59_9PEZI|nr:hypothetical protein MKZ38_009041 [Zalerion maritima]
MPPPKRMTANRAKPIRHRAGKPAGASSSESSSDSDSDAPATTKKPKRAPPLVVAKPKGAGQVISRGSGKIDLASTREDAAIQRAELEAMAKDAGFETESEGGDEAPATRVPGPPQEASSEEEEGESSEEEEESSSEEEAPRRLMIRPKFIPKSQRAGAADAGAKKQEEEEAAKKKVVDALVEEQIRIRAMGKRKDDDDSSSDVDTADDVDPEAEYAAWKLRELKRLKRDRDQLIAREKEREEIERRRNLTAEEREQEDAEKNFKLKEEKESRGKAGFMQKYFHKGAFYQGDAAKEGLLDRDIMGAKFQDVANRELLPKALQMRDMTKLGKKGASKYRDLKSEDTGSWGNREGYRGGGGGRRGFDGDDRFAPDADGRSAKGSNMIPLGERKDRDRRDDRPRDRYDDDRRSRDRGDRYGDRNRDRRPREDREGSDRHRDSREIYRDRSRSSSPRQEGDDDRDDYYRSRKREGSRDRERRGDDKRRRVDSRY